MTADRVAGVNVTVRVMLGDYTRLARIAERRGHDTIGALLEAIVAALGQTRDVHDEVELLVRAGLTDADIADHLGLIVGTVADRRRRLGLPANHRYRTTEKRRAS